MVVFEYEISCLIYTTAYYYILEFYNLDIRTLLQCGKHEWRLYENEATLKWSRVTVHYCMNKGKGIHSEHST